MRTLITGAAGFIGSHLADRLVADGHHVIALDNFATGNPQNLAHHQGCSALEIVEADIARQSSVCEYFRDVDWVFHLAALADIVPSINRPLDYHKANVDGTVAVLECSRQAGVKRFIYAASSSCYGIPDAYPTPETAAIRPQYPYALTKYLAELEALHWHQVYGLPVVSLRFFNVYGPRSRTSGTYGAVFGVFLAQKLAGKPFTVVGDGSQRRDFTFVTDVVEACVMAAQSDAEGEAFNVGSGRPASVNRLVELLEGEVVYVPKRPGEPDLTQADNTRIRERIGWTPRVPLEDGVSILLENIEYWRQAPVWTPERIAQATEDWFKYLGPKAE